jgi:hypothetical protein
MRLRSFLAANEPTHLRPRDPKRVCRLPGYEIERQIAVRLKSLTDEIERLPSPCGLSRSSSSV